MTDWCSSDETLRSPTVSISAHCSSCANVGCCLSELIFKRLLILAGSSIQHFSTKMLYAVPSCAYRPCVWVISSVCLMQALFFISTCSRCFEHSKPNHFKVKTALDLPTLMMLTACRSETSVSVYKTKRPHNPEGYIPNNPRHQNLKDVNIKADVYKSRAPRHSDD